MLKLLVRNNDICRVSKLLVKNKLRAYVTRSIIIIKSDNVGYEIINQLCNMVDIIVAQNYYDIDDILEIQEETEIKHTSVESESKISEENESVEEVVYLTDDELNEKTIQRKVQREIVDENFDEESALDEFYQMFGVNKESENNYKKRKVLKIPEEEMLYRGEVYKWGSIKYEERRILECVVIIQNDNLEITSDETIALFCSSRLESRSQLSFSFRLCEQNMIDHSITRLGAYDRCTMFVNQIRGIKRKDVGKYLGKLNSSFMSTLQPQIDYCLGIKRKKDLNWNQLKMLSTVNVSKLLLISEEKENDSKKINNILEFFGFDMDRNGMNYVKRAALVASLKRDYRLEDLVKSVAKYYKAEESEVLRLIVARIKENFHFRKSPAISFIRLVDRLLKKEG